MSLALDTTPTRHLSAVPEAAPAAPAPAPASGSASASAPASAPRLRAVPDGTEARGFVLYVGIDELKALEAGTSLGEIVSQLKALTQQLAPSAETHAAVALAPEGAGGRDVDVVRLALHDPAALAKHRGTEIDEEPGARGGVVVDISRKRLLLDGDAAPLTYKEFELLQYLVLREGRTIDRAELISSLWSAADDEVPNERTIDVHVRRLRSKLGAFEDIVRTVRGVGYRFDRHADVSIRQASTPSPDVF
ncbi:MULTISPECIES: winged helix-turn-helix domain-containing protein [unclassified Frondihabitans]|uniref:winged helix-turn-helix domain-containing protein n=1 Tax=unclassified Frondihabitans TaxID=2626248 RepID=UPI000F4DECC1|nr:MULTISPECIES: winged helix-turn-helix domain-containing protein [unclassified Frondihabitans]RPE78851.1 transcriptional regulator [Frondihabitans sp. PhB153]RPF09132.1 transcriptional regulator [Frondihabitans sp. PhB161]